MGVHLQLSRDFLAIDFSGFKVWYDEANYQLVLLQLDNFYTLNLELGARLSEPFQYRNVGKLILLNSIVFDLVVCCRVQNSLLNKSFRRCIGR